MPRKLKVFRTPIGFHDAYVAASSRKAALAAWGADADLFARGMAEEVTDPALMKEPLARPGEVLRTVRGTVEQHLAALPADAPSPAPRGEAEPAPARTKPTTPRPTRDELEASEAALTEAEHDRASALRDLSAREAALARERRDLEREHARLVRDLEAARDAADARYHAAVTAWRAG